jgi:flagellin-like protein
MTNQDQFKFKKGVSGPLGILIVLLFTIFAGGILLWQTSKKEEILPPEIKLPEKIKKGEIELPEEEIREEIIKDETANWRTYRNEKHGFEIKYPREWFVYWSERTEGGPKHHWENISNKM